MELNIHPSLTQFDGLRSKLLSNSINQIVISSGQFEMENEEIDSYKYGIKCFLCQKLYTDIDELQDHLQNHSIEITENPALKYYNCDVCGRGLRSEEELKKHIKRFHGTHLIKKEIEAGNRFKCDKCSDIYIGSDYLEKHKQMAHNVKDGTAQPPIQKELKIITRIISAKPKYAPRSPFFNP
ncbi:uncharacterized zinc finger protein CG12744 isoform X2 [Drosophila mojavensis]|nr:uncharacterized zinc finger protein CG12744 isoform X2 [Drosophila mojavensis]EDW09230.2 uncharacterized protein Dmoj_GI19159, isoform A [Drosophila mojavensis]